MSDSPLDGGSGWSTSAYAIVPARSAPVPAALPAERPVASPPDPPARSGRRGVLVTAVAVLLVVGAIVTVALLRPAGGVQRAAGAPAASVTTGGGDGATRHVGGPGAGTDVGSAGVILRAGTVRMAVAVGQPEEAFDLDAGVKGTASAFAANQLPDLAAAAAGLTGLNGARFSAWTMVAAPSPAACAAIPVAQWSGSVLLAALVPNAVSCVRTSDDRYGALTVQAMDALGGADAFSASLAFTVWKKPGD
jgi:hypothetical protein